MTVGVRSISVASLKPSDVLKLWRSMLIRCASILTGREGAIFTRNKLGELSHPLDLPCYSKYGEQRFLGLQHARLQHPKLRGKRIRSGPNRVEQSILISGVPTGITRAV